MKPGLAAVIALGFLCICRPAGAEVTAAQKAADQLLRSMPQYFKNIDGMSPDRELALVLGEAEKMVQAESFDKVKDEIKDAVKGCAREGLRIKYFQEDALPLIRGSLTAGQSFDWGLIDTAIDSKIDTRLNQLNLGLTLADAGWDAVQAFDEGKSGGAVFISKILEEYIPYYKAYRIAVDETILLVSAVLAYATDTAVDGMLEDLYQIKSRPGEFGRWLLNASPDVMTRDLNDKWELAGYSRVWEGKGTDVGAEEMKNRLYGRLLDMRSALALKLREERLKQEALEKEMEKYYVKFRDAEAKAKGVADKARAFAAPGLTALRDFRLKYNGIVKEEAEQQAVEIEAEIEQVSSGAGEINYQSLRVDDLLSALGPLLEQISDSAGSGYDPREAGRLQETYRELESTALASHRAARDAAIAKAETEQRQIWKKFGEMRASMLEGFFAKEVKTDEDYKEYSRVEALIAEQQAIAMKPVNAVLTYYPQLYGEERALLATRKTAATAEAAQRGAVLDEQIKTALAVFDLNVENAAAEVTEQWEKITAQRRKLNDEENSLYYYMLNTDLGAPLVPENPGEVLAARDYFSKGLDLLVEQEGQEAQLIPREKAVIEQYLATVDALESQLKDTVPPKLLEITAPGDGSSVLKSIQVNGFGVDANGSAVGLNFHGVHTIPNPWFVKPEGVVAYAEEQQRNVRSRIEAIRGRLAALEDLAWADAQMSAAGRLELRISNSIPTEDLQLFLYNTLEEEKELAGNAFKQLKLGGLVLRRLDPEKSAGAARLARLRTLWANNEQAIRDFDKLLKAVNGRITYKSYDYIGSYRRIADIFLSIEKRIALYEKAQAEAKDQYKLAVEAFEAYFHQREQRLEELQKSNWLPELLMPEAEALLKDVDANIKSTREFSFDPTVAADLPRWEELRKKIELFIAELERRIKERFGKGTSGNTDDQATGGAAGSGGTAVAGGGLDTQLVTTETALVRELYTAFRSAYEALNASLVMSLISDDWSAGDGTTLADLEANLSRSFRVFNQITFEIGGLSIIPRQAHDYLVSYDVTITSRIYSRNLKHVEKSSVSEEVSIDENGRARIARTPAGRFWLIE